ncbi:cupin domain-containing protein [Hyphomicrobium sp.]|uniref:cupin domain-containing protein n=1 Tax=Hyphomicrobium sp. TaxID=82 RepID=UPI002D79C5FC|nr:cupin domain-containing protein [Hyphomicrobium sp.]HET6388385.1 cupin domain-containing protein [Hyphomicrobium sp.]
MRFGLVAAAMVALACPAFAEESGHADNAIFHADEIDFKDNPAFPPGAKTAVLLGDASKPGLFIIQVKLPPNYTVPAHMHPSLETVVMLKGSMGLGGGKTVEKTGKLLQAGSTFLVPPMHPHYCWTGDEGATFQVTVNAPFDLIYVNPADDPRKK